MLFEGTFRGIEHCDKDGVDYHVDGHFIGSDTVAYLAWVVDARGRLVGYVQGQVAAAEATASSDVQTIVESRVRHAVRDGTFPPYSGPAAVFDFKA